MKNKHILILGLVFLILVVVVVVSRSSGPEPQTEIREDTLVGEFDTGQAGHIEFYHGEKPARKVILKKKNGNWTVPSRFGARADTKRIDKLLAGLPGLSGEARVRELSLFGEFDITEEQAVHLIVRDTGDSEITHLLVGKAGPDWRSGFARKAGGNSVYLVNVALLSLLGVSRPMTGALAGFDDKQWLDLKILPDVDAGKVAGIHLGSPRTDLSFERAPKQEKQEEGKEKGDGKTQWNLATEGIPYKANDRGVDALVRGLVSRRADEVADPAKNAEYGFEGAKYIATLTFEDKSRKKIVIGGEVETEGGKQFYLKVQGDPLPYIVAQYVVDRLFEDAGKLLEMQALDLPEKDVVLITLKTSEKEIALGRHKGGEWYVAWPELGFEERKDAPKRLAEKFVRFEPEDLLNLVDDLVLAGEPEYSVMLVLADGETKYIDVWQEVEGTDGDRYVTVDKTESVFSVGERTLTQLFPELTTLLEVRLADVNRQGLEMLEIEREGQKFALRRESEQSQNWMLDVYGYTFKASEEKVSNIRDYFTKINPTEVLGKVDLAGYGLEEPVITVRSSDGKKSATIIVSGRKDVGGTRHYAAEVESGIVFTIVDKALEAAKVRLSQLAPLRIFPTDGEPDSISVLDGDISLMAKRQEIEKDGKKTKVWVSQEGEELDESAVRRVISRVRNLQATDIIAPPKGCLQIGAPGFATLGVGEEFHTLALHNSNEKEKVRYCVLDGKRDAVIVVRQSLLEQVFKQAAKIAESPKIKEPDKK